MLDEIARLIAHLAPDVHVEIAHMELAEPTIAQGFAACVEAGASDVTVCPYMLAPGRHASEDIPRLVAEAAARYAEVDWRVSAELGVDERLAEVVLRRVEEAVDAGGWDQGGTGE